MNTNAENNDSLALNFNIGGNSPPANLRYNGSPLAAFKMELELERGAIAQDFAAVFSYQYRMFKLSC